MHVLKRNRGGLWSDGYIDFYITDDEFDRVAKVTFTKQDKKVYLTVVKSFTSKHLEESSPLELLVLTGLHRGNLEEVIRRTPR